MGAWRVWALWCTARREIKKGTHESPQYCLLSLLSSISLFLPFAHSVTHGVYTSFDESINMCDICFVCLCLWKHGLLHLENKLEMHLNSFECTFPGIPCNRANDVTQQLYRRVLSQQVGFRFTARLKSKIHTYNCRIERIQWRISVAFFCHCLPASLWMHWIIQSLKDQFQC